MSEKPISPIKFPTKTPVAPALTLRRRRSQTHSPFEVSEASTAARQSIKEIVSATMTPWGEAKSIDSDGMQELEKNLRQLESMLAERERIVSEAEDRITEKERDLAEGEALLQARENMLKAASKQTPAKAPISKEEQEALAKLKAELDQQEEALKESKQQLRDRETFLEESENKLFEKVQSQQEKEMELEHQAEGLAALEERLKQKQAEIDPKAAKALWAAKAAKTEFNEFTD